MLLGIIVTVLGVAGSLMAEWRKLPWLRSVAKPIASLGFLLAAVRAPQFVLPTELGWLLLAGLVLSALGDVLLLGKRTVVFIAGMGAFALAHIAFGAWFIANTLPLVVLLGPLVAFVVIGHLAWRWLDPYVKGSLRIPVRVYVLLVSVMAATALTFAVTSRAVGLSMVAGLGGLLFFLSDLAVARQRFVKPEFLNRAWGQPTYYLAVLLIASAVAA